MEKTETTHSTQSKIFNALMQQAPEGTEDLGEVTLTLTERRFAGQPAVFRVESGDAYVIRPVSSDYWLLLKKPVVDLGPDDYILASGTVQEGTTLPAVAIKSGKLLAGTLKVVYQGFTDSTPEEIYQ